MKTLYVLILSIFLACISISKLYGQAPGGVLSPDFWIKSDDAGAISTAWKDHSANANNIPNVGGMTLSLADRAHNFHPFTTGYTASKFFYNATSVMNPLGNVELPNISTSIFSAVRPTTVNGTGRITGIDDDTNAAEPGISIAAGKPRQYEFFNTTTSTDFSTTFNTGVSNIFSAIANNIVANGGTSAITGGEKRLGLNGAYESFSGFAATNKFQMYGRNLRIGHAGWDAGGAFPGDIMEVIWYKRTLTANEQSRVNSYLAVKNGVTSAENYLASNSSVVWDRIINTSYNNNIFGIARDNISALHQKQSGSINDAQKLVLSTTGFAESNAANSTELANDLQFLMIGDNGLFQGLKMPLSYSLGSNGIVNFRFESIWKVQNTGSVGTVTVAWPKGINNLYLVQSTDATFDATDTFTPMTAEVTVNGVVYNTVNVMLTDGHFFTFAGFGNAPGGVAVGLSYWYRADKNALNTGAGTDVTGWTDVWNGTTVAQLGTNTLPKYALGASNYFNFNPGINFTVGTQTLGNNTVRTLTSLDYDVFTLTKENLASGGTNPRLFSTGMDNTTTNDQNWDGFGIFPNNTNLERRPYGGSTQFPAVAPAFNATIPSIMYFRNTNTSSRKGLNGDAMATIRAYNAVGNMFGGHIFGDTRFSSNGSDNAGFIGHIGETIIYGAGTLSDVERRRVDSYLAIKYGITLGQVNTDHYLDASAATVWNGATNTAYNNNIFGIAREDIGLFEQKVSTSVNAGTILTIATTNDFINPNEDAARTSFAQDKTYLLLGDNNNINLALNSITVNGFTGGSRIQRQWLAQPTNTVGAVNFGVDLSAYGAGFVSGASVKMIVADDASFTTNVVYVGGTYEATSGKWVHSYSFTSGQNKYITYVTVDETSCTTGCNDNTYLNATDPNTIEYDNLVASDNAVVAKEKDGTFKIWGYGTSPTANPSNSNLVLDLLIPTAITPANGFAYTGTPLKAAVAGLNPTASILLTTTGLYGWGSKMVPYTKTTNNMVPAFGKVTVNGKTDGLPPGVSPTNVKMLFQTYMSWTVVTCSGAVWTMNGYANGGNYLYGDGMTVNATNNLFWHRVKISATETLDNVVAVRGSAGAKLALTSDGKLYTWGMGTYIGDGNDNANSGTHREFATEVLIPNGVTPKMIGMTEDAGAGDHAYFLLATNGKLFAMGHNGEGILGDGTQTASNVWKEVTATSGGHTLGGNMVWISPNEHGRDTSPTMNVLTNDKKQWGWGSSLSYKLGEPNTANGYAPIYMPGNTINANGMGLNDEVIAVETGGLFTMNHKNGNPNYGFVGASAYGTIGNGSTGNSSFQKYTYNTAILDLCGLLSTVCTMPGVFDAAGLPSTMGVSDLAGFAGGATGWPANVTNGFIVVESKNKGFVITRVANTAAILTPVEGMLVYDISASCVKLYNGTAWSCLAKSCN